MNKYITAIESFDLDAWLKDNVETKGSNGNEVQLRDCPKCGNSNYKVYVNIVNKLWLCMVCEWGRGLRDPAHIISAITGKSLSSSRIEILQETAVVHRKGDILNQLASIFDEVEDATEEELTEEGPTIDLPGRLLSSSDGIIANRVKQYCLSERGLTSEEVEVFNLAFTSKIKGFVGPFVVFPITQNGILASWQGRRVNNSNPKYVSNSNVKECLWPYDLVNKGIKRVTLVEGVFDAIWMHRHNIPALCTFGKSLSKTQFSLINELNVDELIFGWDVDAAQQIENTKNRISNKFKDISVVDFNNSPFGNKTDPGEALLDVNKTDWILNKMENRINTKSQEYFNWLLSK